MQLFRMNTIAGVAAALALSASPTMATAATAIPVQSMSPLVAVSVFGTPATAAVLAQAQVPGGGPVLPQTDVPPLPPQPSEAAPQTSGFGISPIILGLLGIAALAALIASSGDDSDSPSSPS